MSTIKISQLPNLPSISANTSNTLFLGVDSPTETTGKFTATTLAQQLFANNYLVVGQNYHTIYSNTVAQFTGYDPQYLQVNNQNFNSLGTADFVVTADTGSPSNSYIDMGITNSQYYTNGYSTNPYDGYLYVQGPATANVGNLVIGTALANTSLIVAVGNQLYANSITAYFKQNTFTTLYPITFADGSQQNTASYSIAYLNGLNASQNTFSNSINTYSYAAFAVANSAQANTIYTQGVYLTQNTIITNAYNQANLANSIANTALQNTSTITVNNNINVPGTVNTKNLIVTSIITANTGNTYLNSTNFNGYLTITNSSYNSNSPLINITAAGSTASIAPSNSDYIMQITGKDYYPTRVIFDNFGPGNTYSLLAGRSGRGTAASPTATQSGDVLMRVSGNGYGATGFNGTGVARMDVVATENFTDTNHGAQIQFWSTTNGSNTLNQIATLSGNTATFIGTVNPTKGFIYTPNIYPSSQTAITIDFANNSVVRAQTATGLTATLANFVTGKVVEAWITNTAVGAETFTHGVSATNSTVNATTYSIPGTATIYVKYWCMDGTLANTFCAITHA